jgi:hypothetical protein
MAADVNVARSYHPWGRRIVMVRKAKRGVVPAQHLENFLIIPARVTKLERALPAPRDQVKERGNPLPIGSHSRRQLKEHRASFWPKRL